MQGGFSGRICYALRVPRPVCLLLAVLLASGCEDAEDRFTHTRVKRPAGPRIESVPARLKSCAPKPQPQVTVLPTPSIVPLKVQLVRSYHICLGEYAALLRFKHTGKRKIVGLTLERQWWDVRRKRPPHRDRQRLIRTFEKGTVRYLRIRWREGYKNPGERQVRIRLARVDYVGAPPWSAGAWPELPPPPVPPHAAASLPEQLHEAHDSVRAVTKKVNKIRKKVEETPLVRYRPRPRP